MFEYARGIDDVLFLGIYNIAFALIFVSAGIWSSLRGVKNRTNLAFTQRQVVTWKVIVPEAYLTSPFITQVTSTVARLRGWGLIAAGACAVLNALSWMSFAAITNINPTHDQPVIGATYASTWLISLLAGYGIGHAAGVWRLRQLVKRQPAYGEIRRRSLDDYRSPILGWVCPAFTLAWVIVTTLLLPNVHATDSVPAALNPQSSIFLLDAFLLPAQMLMVTVITELVLRWVAQLPRLLIVPDPAVAQRADDIVRATTIGVFQGWQFIVIGFLGASQGALLSLHLTAIHVNLCLTLLSVVNPIVLLSGIVLFLFAHGRIGGTLTGWRWHTPRRRLK